MDSVGYIYTCEYIYVTIIIKEIMNLGEHEGGAGVT